MYSFSHPKYFSYLLPQMMILMVMNSDLLLPQENVRRPKRPARKSCQRKNQKLQNLKVSFSDIKPCPQNIRHVNVNSIFRTYLVIDSLLYYITF